MAGSVPPTVPREEHTLRLMADRLDTFREWAENGTALTAASRVWDPEGRIALVQTSWSDGWVLPGGGVEPDESLRAAAGREIREETGLDATVGDPIVVLDQTYTDAATGEETYTAEYVVFDAQASGRIPHVSRLGVEPDEIHAAQWFDSLPADLHDGNLLRPYL